MDIKYGRKGSKIVAHVNTEKSRLAWKRDWF